MTGPDTSAAEREDGFTALLAASSLGSAVARGLRHRVDPERSALAATISALQAAAAHDRDGSQLLQLGRLLEQAGDPAAAETCYQQAALLALDRLAGLHERHHHTDQARLWRSRADALKPSAMAAARSDAELTRDDAATEEDAIESVAPPPRVVTAGTRVAGHDLVQQPHGGWACSCGWVARAGDTTAVADHLRTAWPILVARRAGEPADRWRNRVQDVLRAAVEDRDRLWNEYGLGKPLQPGHTVTILPPGYLRADDRVRVLEHQFEQTNP